MTKIYIKTLLTICVFILTTITTNAQTQVIINEFSQGPNKGDPGYTGNGGSEWIELVVTADNTDISGVYVDDDGDYDSDGNIWNDKYVQFRTDVTELQSLPKGSIIVIYRGDVPKDPYLPADDLTFGANHTIIVPHTDFNWFIDRSPLIQPPWPGFQGGGDAFGIFNSDGTGIHGIAYGVKGTLHQDTWSTAFPSGTSWGMTDLTSYDVQQGFEISFQAGSPNDLLTAGNWTVQSYTSSTGGSLNGGGNNALPVELSSFSAVINKTSVNLIWKTQTEVNNYGFEVQRSSKSEDWKTLGFVNGSGNSNSPKNYNFEDNDVNTSGKYSYRLKQIDNDGLYEYSKTIEENLGTPVSTELKQNYPNPFNPTTTINFTLPASDQVSLIIYNAIGEQVKVLYNGMLEAGVHSFNFNGDELPSGLYVYKLSTSSSTQIKKMMLLK